jgi:dTDP-4-dehydrorhamnose 3,5-epimerase
MKFIESPLAGAFLIEQSPLSDERGYFARTFCAREFRAHGLIDQYVQTNHSLTRQLGTIRGLHYQVPPHAEAKLVRCVRGAVQDVIVDLRRGSTSFLRWHSEVLTDRNFRMIYAPPGFAHGFQALTDDAEVTYQSSAFYAPEHERQVRFDDPRVRIIWMVPEVNVSAKDASCPDLPADFEGLTL